VSGPVKVGLAGLAIGVALAVRLLAPAGWDVSVVGAFGEDVRTDHLCRTACSAGGW
jgi:stage V sporulation protein SpoVS